RGKRFVNVRGIRSVVCHYGRRRVIKRVRHFYPAPLSAIEAVEKGMRMDVLEGSLSIEQPRLMDLLAGPVSLHLVGLFLAGEKVKRGIAAVPDAVTRVGGLGAGLLGLQIARQLAEKSYSLVVRD